MIIISTISCDKKAIDKPTITKITPEKFEAIKDTISQKTLVHFWFSYCQPCIKEIPELNKFVKDKKLQIIHISSDKSDSKMQENLEKVITKYPFFFRLDFTLATAFSVQPNCWANSLFFNLKAGGCFTIDSRI